MGGVICCLMGLRVVYYVEVAVAGSKWCSTTRIYLFTWGRGVAMAACFGQPMKQLKPH